jgi:hypothetical protein
MVVSRVRAGRVSKGRRYLKKPKGRDQRPKHHIATFSELSAVFTSDKPEHVHERTDRTISVCPLQLYRV